MQALDTTRGAPRGSPAPRLRPWNAAAIAIAVALLAPIAVVGANLFVPGGEAWAHLASTVLPDYALNSLALVAMVAAGTSRPRSDGASRRHSGRHGWRWFRLQSRQR